MEREHKWEYDKKGKHVICGICGLLKCTYVISGKDPRLECEVLKPNVGEKVA